MSVDIEKIKNYIYQYLKDTNIKGNDFDENTDLLKSGIIDSYALISLITDLQDKFNIIIPFEYMIPENFSTLKSIMVLIDKLCVES